MSENNSDWILLSQKMPPSGKRILISIKYLDFPYDAVYQHDAKQFTVNGIRYSINDVDAWMPLPKKYVPEFVAPKTIKWLGHTLVLNYTHKPNAGDISYHYQCTGNCCSLFSILLILNADVLKEWLKERGEF